MKTFIFDLVDRLKRIDNALDVKVTLCNKTWRAFSDSNEKELHIFLEDGNLIISINGEVTMGRWMYLPSNKSLVISNHNQKFMVHPVLCNDILVFVQDGTNMCSFLVDSTKQELDRVNTIDSMHTYILNNLCNFRTPIIDTPHQENSLTQTNFKFDKKNSFWPNDDIHVSDPNLVYRRLDHSFYYLRDGIYVLFHGDIKVQDGNLYGRLITSSASDDNIIMIWLSVDGGKNFVGRWYINCEDHSKIYHSDDYFQNTWGFGISRASFEEKFLPRFKNILEELFKFRII